MDWSAVALVTYIFALLFLLAYMIMRSYRGTKKKYAKLLDEKQQKLSRMQIDIEETMEGLEVYAEEIRKEWSLTRESQRESFTGIQEHSLKLAASIVDLKGQINIIRSNEKRMAEQIEHLYPAKKDSEEKNTKLDIENMSESCNDVCEAEHTGDEVINQTEANEAEDEAAADVATKDQIAGKDDLLTNTELIEQENSQMSMKQRVHEAVQMLEMGADITETARAFDFSVGELELIMNRKSRERKQ